MWKSKFNRRTGIGTGKERLTFLTKMSGASYDHYKVTSFPADLVGGIVYEARAMNHEGRDHSEIRKFIKSSRLKIRLSYLVFAFKAPLKKTGEKGYTH